MRRFFARIFAIILSVSVFVVGAVLLAQIQPISSGGWIVIALAGIGIIAGPILIYHLVMKQVPPKSLTNEGEGAGLVMGVGIDSARRRDGDADPDGDGFGFD